ncbi:hypothetical protein Nmel_016170 [Mimus melanotis]
MADPAVSAHLEGIISDFEALKRSFEVEEVDQSSNSSTPQRRAPNTLLRSTVSSSTQKFQELGARNSEPSRHAEPTVQRSPKPPLRRVELSGPKLPEPVSRRTEISIDISSKQVENSTSGLSRFGLKRADVGHKPPEPAARRTEITLGKPQEPRRAEVPASKIPELPQRRAEPAGTAEPTGTGTAAAPRRLDSPGTRAAETPASRPAESSEPALATQPQQPEPKPQPAPVESPAKREEGELDHLYLGTAQDGVCVSPPLCPQLLSGVPRRLILPLGGWVLSLILRGLGCSECAKL